MYLFFDTETTGLPLRWNAPLTDLDNWPRLVQLSWILSDEQGTPLGKENLIVQPDGFEIPYGAARVHGITTERAEKEGVPLGDALSIFLDSLDGVHTVVGHNISFDEKIIGAEFLRNGMPDPLEGKKKVCTMRGATTYCALPGRDGAHKWPNLNELHTKLFSIGFDGAHDAGNDIAATARCFWELRKRGVL